MGKINFFEILPMPSVVFDLQNNTIASVNVAFSELVGININELVGKSCSFLDSFITTKDENSILGTIFSGTEADDEIALIRSVSEVKQFFYRTKTIVEDDFALCLCIFETIRVLKDSNLDKQNQQLFPSQNHELRSALTTLVGVAQLLSEQEATHKISDLDEKTLIAIRSVISILDVGTLPVDDRLNGILASDETPDLVQLIRNVIHGFEQQIQSRHIQVKFMSFKKVVQLNIDKQAFFDIVFLLLNNAISSTENNEIRIFLSEKSDEKGAIIALKISDSGIGIKKSFLEILSGSSKILSKYELSAEDQIYFDLLKCRHLVEDLCGNMQIESQYGRGTSITIHFYIHKLTQNPLPKPDSTPAKIVSPGIDEKISFIPEVLLVDDDQMVFRLIDRFLQGRCSLEYAMDGRRALSAIARKHFDIIFMDINLGVGLTGLQVVKKIRQLHEYFNTPIVAITAYAMPGDKEKALDSGCTMYQSKPFVRADIINVFNLCLNKILKN